MPESCVCFHCGLPNQREPAYRLDTADGPLHFCCPGCLAVASTILASGLGNYYDYRDKDYRDKDYRGQDYRDQDRANEQRARGEPPATDFSRYDRAEFQRGFVHQEGDTRCAQLTIGGISCAACTWLIEHRLAQLDGIERVHVNLARRRATIHWHSDRLALGTIFATIDAIGYIPAPHSPDREEQLIESEQRSALLRLGVAGLGMMQVGMFAIALHAGQLQGMAELHRDFLRLVSLIVATAVVFYAARPFFSAAWRGLKQHSPGMDLPVALAIGLAYGASAWATLTGGGEVYFDSVAMFTFFLLGSRYLEMRARHQSERVSRGLAALQAPYAWRLSAGADDTLSTTQAEQVPADQLAAGDSVLVKPGELVPADGSVASGRSSIDESAFSGEYLPVSKGPGDPVTAGSINGDGLLTIRVDATRGQTRLDLITRLLERAQADKPRSAQLADRLARYFVFAVLLCAAATAAYWLWRQPDQAFWIALSVLVVSCPCALSLATPTAVTAALSSLKTHGLLLSRSETLEALPATTTIVFDKTGTLTTGTLVRVRTQPLGALDREHCLSIAAALESHSNHPIAAAFRSEAALPRVADCSIEVGCGITGTIGGQPYTIGSPAWLSMLMSEPPPPLPASEHVQILLAGEQGWLAAFELQDAVRPTAARALAALRRRGLALCMLSGDSSGAVGQVARQLGIADYQGGLSPQQKLQRLRQRQARGERLLMVGDGVNDVPVLAAADVSIAVVNATALAKASADGLLLGGDLDGLNTLLDTAQRTRRIVQQNLAWALLYNVTAIPLAASGHIPPWLAALGMSASSLVVVGNALRLTRRRRPEPQAPTRSKRPTEPHTATVPGAQ